MGFGKIPRLNSGKLRALAIVIASGAFIWMAGSQVAQALNAYSFPPSIKTSINDYNSMCAGIPEKYQSVRWMSKGGAPTTTSVITVPYGTTKISLQYNPAIFLCHDLVNENSTTYPGLPNDGTPTSAAKLRKNINYISKATVSPSGTLSPSPVGRTSTINYDGNHRYWFAANDEPLPYNNGTLGFDYQPSAPLTTTQTITVTLYNHNVNYYASGNYYCVKDGGSQQAGTTPPTYGCPAGAVSFSMKVNVAAWSIAGTSTISKTSATPGTSVTWKHYIKNNGPGAYTANVFKWRVVRTLNGVAVTNPGLSNNVAQAAGNNYNYRNTVFTIPSSAKNGDVYCEQIRYDRVSSTNDANGASSYKCVTVNNSGCGSVGFSPESPSPIQPGDNYKFNLTVTNSPPITGGTFRVSGDLGTFTLAQDSQSGSTVTSAYRSATAGAAKTYQITYGFYDKAGTAITTGCPGEIAVVDIPYFKVYGSGISAGGDFDCTAGDISHAGIIGGWYNNGAALAGASAQLNAVAMGQIAGFGSAQNVSPPGPLGLTFANDLALPAAASDYSPNLGGNFGGTHCLWNPEAPDDAESVSGTTAAVGSGSLVDGAHVFDGNLELTGGNVASPNNVSVFVPGDVYISDPITYNPGWTNNKVPSFTLVAEGNIFISPGVSQLDGIYVAKGGNIYTCGNADFTPLSVDNLYSGCNQQLTIRGSFVAKRINLMRTLGTLKDANNGEHPRALSRPCANGSSQAVCAGEVFDFSPEVYLSNPKIKQGEEDNKCCDAVTALPPIL